MTITMDAKQPNSTLGGTGNVTSARRSLPRRLGRGLYRTVRNLLALGMALHLLLVFTPLTNVLQRWLDVTQPARSADAIVCLGGRDRRLIWAAELYHEGFAPHVIVSAPPGCADKMRDRLVLMGVPGKKILLDRGPRTTADHPHTIARLPGIDPQRQRFLIVTDTAHSRRTAACFRHAGYRDFIVYAGRTSGDFSEASGGSSWRGRVINLPIVAYEYTALLLYRLRGHI